MKALKLQPAAAFTMRKADRKTTFQVSVVP